MEEAGPARLVATLEAAAAGEPTSPAATAAASGAVLAATGEVEGGFAPLGFALGSGAAGPSTEAKPSAAALLLARVLGVADMPSPVVRLQGGDKHGNSKCNKALRTHGAKDCDLLPTSNAPLPIATEPHGMPAQPPTTYPLPVPPSCNE